MAGIPPIDSYPLPDSQALPENLARWTPRPERAVLLVHDMQRYFLNVLPEPLRGTLVRNTARLRRRCAALGVPVAYTAQPGGMTDRQRGLLKDFWGAGMRTEPADREVVPELTPAPGDRVFTKWRYSAFFGSDLLGWMRGAGRDQLVVCGVYAHVGVLATALEAFTNDIQPFLAADALGDFSATHHRFALDYVAQRCGVVVSSGEVFA
ncbi:isochorismate hydrolase [Streptosporangium becharense]|uniref:Isochorismate hydrolase n=1 Tax=Streptosporangium becharense TaxID=1816182 RepID=A0A7W9MIE5_9ACTN|nr:isochorismatase family protein [Streptosporangium becharense]MBB2911037.1 isochorismate hydrolase [Streptosporangium becharense]MBB5821905.1 isochorismate hydrolase [Streptosporangium becharense]